MNKKLEIIFVLSPWYYSPGIIFSGLLGFVQICFYTAFHHFCCYFLADFIAENIRPRSGSASSHLLSETTMFKVNDLQQFFITYRSRERSICCFNWVFFSFFFVFFCVFYIYQPTLFVILKCDFVVQRLAYLPIKCKSNVKPCTAFKIPMKKERHADCSKKGGKLLICQNQSKDKKRLVKTLVCLIFSVFWLNPKTELKTFGISERDKQINTVKKNENEEEKREKNSSQLFT